MAARDGFCEAGGRRKQFTGLLLQHAEVEVSPGTPPVASGCILLVVSPSAWLLVGLLSVVTMDWEYGLMGRPWFPWCGMSTTTMDLHRATGRGPAACAFLQ